MPPAERVLTVPAKAAGERLDRWLARSLPETSRASLAALIESGDVLVDGTARPKNQRLRGGEEVTVLTAAAPVGPVASVPEPRIAWEDANLIVLDKPAGLVVHPAAGHRGKTLVELLSERAGGSWQPHAVHRLDRNTSGLMIVAKNDRVKRELQRLIVARAVRREYLALVEGTIRARRGLIEAPLGRDPRERTRRAVAGRGAREARTHFEVERYLGAFTLVRATLDTGRTHQIRAHFAAIGHPVCGDRAYGAGRPGLPPLDLDRQFLHSARLAFRYSGAEEEIDETSSLPDELERALEQAQA